MDVRQQSPFGAVARAGDISYWIIESLERAVDAFLGLFSGRNFGKMVVRI